MKGLEWRPKWYRDFVLRTVPRQSVGAEIGVWKGDFSERILRVVRPTTLHLVDPWKFAGDNPSAWWGANSGQSATSIDAIYNAVQERFRGPIASGQVVLHRATSVEASAVIPDGALDWIYLDGDHLFDPVLRDLHGWWPKIRPGGWVLGDDYNMPESRWKDGVTLATAQFAIDHGVRVNSPGRHQFTIRKPDGVPSPA